MSDQAHLPEELSVNLGGVRLRRTLTFLAAKIPGLVRALPHRWMGPWHRFASLLWMLSLPTKNQWPRRGLLAGWAVFPIFVAGCHSAFHPDPEIGPPSALTTPFPGPRADGSVLLPNQWSLNPVGRQIVVGDFPVQIALHPGGQFAAVLHCGYGPHEIAILNLKTLKIVTRAGLDEAFYGIALSPNGERLYTSGAGLEAIHVLDFRDGQLFGHRIVALHDV